MSTSIRFYLTKDDGLILHVLIGCKNIRIHVHRNSTDQESSAEDVTNALDSLTLEPYLGVHLDQRWHKCLIFFFMQLLKQRVSYVLVYFKNIRTSGSLWAPIYGTR